MTLTKETNDHSLYELIELCKSGDSYAMEKLIALNESYIKGVVRKFTKKEASFFSTEDYYQMAVEAFINNVIRFDLEKIEFFTPSIIMSMAGTIKNTIRDYGYPIKIHRKVFEIRGKLQLYLEQFYSQYMYEPSAEELSSFIGEKVEYVVAAFNSPNPYSLDFTLSDEPGSVSPVDKFLTTYEDGYHLIDTEDLLRDIFSILSDNEREIMEMHYYQGFPQRKIAILKNVSQMYVSRHLNRIIKKIRNYLGVQHTIIHPPYNERKIN